MKEIYVNPQGVHTPIIIRSRTARIWLNKLGFEHQDVRKGVFITGHETPDVVEDRKSFLERMDEIKPFMFEFEESGAMKQKVYPPDCAVGGEDRRPFVSITHDGCTFSANDGTRRAWTRKGDTHLRPKGRGQGIMTPELPLSFGRLNLVPLSQEEGEKAVKKKQD